MKYKTTLSYWELLRLSEVLAMFVMEFLANKPNYKAMPLVADMIKLNSKILQKTLKNHLNQNQELKLSFAYMELLAFRDIFHLLKFDDEDFDSLNIKSKLHQLMVSL